MKVRPGEPVQQAVEDEPIRITLSGKVATRIITNREPRKRIDSGTLLELTGSMTPQPESAAEWVRAVRDEERY